MVRVALVRVGVVAMSSSRGTLLVRETQALLSSPAGLSTRQCIPYVSTPRKPRKSPAELPYSQLQPRDPIIQAMHDVVASSSKPCAREKKTEAVVQAVSLLPSFSSFCGVVSQCILERRECLVIGGGSVRIPGPSWCRAAHVCGFFGTWDRFP